MNHSWPKSLVPALGAAALLVACNNPGAAPSSQALGVAGAPFTGPTLHRSDPQTSPAAGPVTQFASWLPLPPDAENPERAPVSPLLIAPFGVSTTCGDAIVGANEECDDGAGTGLDACTPQCQTRDQPAATGPKTDRLQGAGRHPIAGFDVGFINTYVEFPTDETTIGATLFNVWGQPQHHVNVSAGASPIDEANPVAAALPNGKYAVAWSDFDGDGSDLGVALRKVNGADGTLGPLGVANGGTEFSQANPDLLWTGTELVVAWEDYADAVNGPDLRYRRFDADLNPLSDDVTLAASALPEAAVALAPFNNSWAAAYREGTVDGKENIVVKVGASAFRVGPVLGGSPEDRPALVGLDATHLLVVFAAGTDPNTTGVYNLPRLRYAVIDTAGTPTPPCYAIDPIDDVFENDNSVSQLGPSAVRGPDGVYLAWRSEARSGDAAGDQIWLKYVSWDVAATTKLDLREKETLIPRTCEGSIGDQRTPELALVSDQTLPPSGALAVAWDDYSRSQGSNAGEPDVVVHYAPLRPRVSALPLLVTEDWSGTSGASWPANWTVAPSATAVATIQGNKGRVATSSGAAFAVGYLNDHTALDVDMVTKVTWNLNEASGALIARLADSDSDTYVAANFGPVANQKFRISGAVDGVPTGDFANVAQPFLFGLWAQTLDFFMRFRVANNADGSVSVKAKLWLTDLPEPTTWTLQSSVPVGSALAGRIGNRPGRFGVVGIAGLGVRTTTFDDFRATFYEGATHGDPSQTPQTGVLQRGLALYRECTAGSKCLTAEGCCTGIDDCASGLACSAAGQGFGVGSHAQTCAPAHCTNRKFDVGEVRVDCGGPDCAPCTCTTAAVRGTAGYATAACPGDIGDGACGTSADCLPGLICVQNSGYRYHFSTAVGVCRPFHCLDRIQDGDELGIDWGASCGDVQCAPTPAPGQPFTCTPSCPCAARLGSCTYNDECLAGLVCSAKGANFNVAWNVCLAPHCTNKMKDADETKVDCGGADCGANCP